MTSSHYHVVRFMLFCNMWGCLLCIATIPICLGVASLTYSDAPIPNVLWWILSLSSLLVICCLCILWH
jgi:hypothetical protein